jgi:RNA recognition motif-containing protein
MSRSKALNLTLPADEGAPSVKKPRLQMPDEYLPPNNVLFVQNLPEGTTQEDLREVFEPHPGLVEIRTIAAKRDIAFIEYADEASATVAKGALHNFKIDGETKMKVRERATDVPGNAADIYSGHVREEVNPPPIHVLFYARSLCGVP